MNEIIAVDWENLPATRELQRQINNLPIAAEGKLALHRIAGITTIVGERVVEIGRKIIAFALAVLKEFPSLSLAVIAAVAINAILATFPLIGPLFQPLYGPLVLAAGVTLGTLVELRDGDLRVRIQILEAEFERIFG